MNLAGTIFFGIMAIVTIAAVCCGMTHQLLFAAISTVMTLICLLVKEDGVSLYKSLKSRQQKRRRYTVRLRAYKMRAKNTSELIEQVRTMIIKPSEEIVSSCAVVVTKEKS